MLSYAEPVHGYHRLASGHGLPYVCRYRHRPGVFISITCRSDYYVNSRSVASDVRPIAFAHFRAPIERCKRGAERRTHVRRRRRVGFCPTECVYVAAIGDNSRETDRAQNRGARYRDPPRNAAVERNTDDVRRDAAARLCDPASRVVRRCVVLARIFSASYASIANRPRNN